MIHTSFPAECNRWHEHVRWQILPHHKCAEDVENHLCAPHIDTQRLKWPSALLRRAAALLSFLGIIFVSCVCATMLRRQSLAGQSRLQPVVGLVDAEDTNHNLSVLPGVPGIPGSSDSLADIGSQDVINETIYGEVQDAANDAQERARSGIDALKNASSAKRPGSQMAQCIVLVLTAVQTLAKVGANIYQVTRTCSERYASPLIQKLGLREEACAINVQFLVGALVTIASRLAAATSLCANATNVDALCTSSSLTMATSLEMVAASAQVISLSCERASNHSKALADHGPQPPPTLLLGKVKHSSSSELSQKRRLFIGGGVDVKTMQCALDVTGAALSLAMMGVALDGAIHSTCPPSKVHGLAAQILRDSDQKVWDRIEVNGCNADMSRVLGGLASAATLLTMTPLHCAKKFNFETLCGVGVSGTALALLGIAGSSSGIYLSCKVGEREYMQGLKHRAHKAIKDASNKAAQKELDLYCPGMNLSCALELEVALTPCGGDGISAQCPSWPSNVTCPGIQECLSEFEAHRNSSLGWPWPPQSENNWTQVGASECLEYAQCLIAFPSTARRLKKESRQTEDDDSIFAELKAAGSMDAANVIWEGLGYNLSDLADEQVLNFSLRYPDSPLHGEQPGSNLSHVGAQRPGNDQGHWLAWFTEHFT